MPVCLDMFRSLLPLNETFLDWKRAHVSNTKNDERNFRFSMAHPLFTLFKTQHANRNKFSFPLFRNVCASVWREKNHFWTIKYSMNLSNGPKNIWFYAWATYISKQIIKLVVCCVFFPLLFGFSVKCEQCMDSVRVFQCEWVDEITKIHHHTPFYSALEEHFVDSFISVQVWNEIGSVSVWHTLIHSLTQSHIFIAAAKRHR